MRPQKITAYTHNNLPQGNTSSGLFLYVKRVLRDLNYKILLFTFVKINLFTQKIGLVLRFFHSSYFTFSQISTIFLKLSIYLLFFQYDKSRVERFSKTKSMFKHVFYKMSLSEFKGIVLSFNFGPVYLKERQMIDGQTNATKFP